MGASSHLLTDPVFENTFSGYHPFCHSPNVPPYVRRKNTLYWSCSQCVLRAQADIFVQANLNDQPRRWGNIYSSRASRILVAYHCGCLVLFTALAFFTTDRLDQTSSKAELAEEDGARASVIAVGGDLIIHTSTHDMVAVTDPESTHNLSLCVICKK